MKHALVKDHIIQTASHLFYQNGYNLTGINEIIKEAGIAKATLYNHFKSKEDICIAYLQHKNSMFISEIKAFVEERKHGENRILALFDYLDQFFNSKEFNGCWCINTISEIPKDNTKIREEILNQKQNLIVYITELIKNNLEGLSKDNSKSIAKQVYLLYESAVSESYLQNDIWPIHSAKTICKQLL
ncbi:TetR/AcrR family transcriptional regulator [Psychroserpens luteolus]|uniref:TetR/AcrR family transcriptional regulator n=1 Tax=Psychroserpens luteolus TaxID=2855840 RepID=UPI001E5FCC23|nr:TetR/AcrR family transcriptional regulator [Psychroserpens luteolus]MCD2260921.1 TetR/AcrR family transcriptional regulator [Psychroserpens luteolus]